MRSLLRCIVKFFTPGEKALSSPEAKARHLNYLWEEREKRIQENGCKLTGRLPRKNRPEPDSHGRAQTTARPRGR